MAYIPHCAVCGHSPTSSQEFSSTIRPSYPDGIAALIKSNNAPSSAEEIQIRAFRTNAENEIGALIAEISQTEAKLTALRQRLVEKKTEVVDYKIILNPLRRLSPQLLSEIFMLSTNYTDPAPDDCAGSLHPAKMHWLLPRVSSHWRSVALSSPRLWSTIDIADYELKVVPLFMLGVQFHRAGSSPLSVSIQSKRSIEPTHPILPMLLPSSPRWKTLFLCLPPTSFTILSPLHPFLPSLTCLQISSRSSHSTEDASSALSTLSTIFKICPSLRQISGDPELLPFDSIPCAQIETYACESDFQMSKQLKVLSSMPNLRQCHIMANCDESDDSHLVLHHLQHLSLEESGMEPRSVLDHLTLPSLETLKFGRNAVQIQSLLDFLKRSQCPLLTLDLTSDWLSDKECFRILKALPSLITLILTCKEVDTLNFINRIIDTPKLVPSLQSLQLLHDEDIMDILLGVSEVSNLKKARPGLSIRYTDSKFGKSLVKSEES